ncbi:hypothetical protein EX30DRAFT_344294 [Ascodesmis nigricans]|uniref:Uncharacterized protein n=1 Tax=Ascodesmis nigricans TaxID=341454 RepID=A0A4S2MJY2_9PEZI|nr:hypothetical protein EX30DRAFT_344294 [Ascodesmis nigricans]
MECSSGGGGHETTTDDRDRPLQHLTAERSLFDQPRPHFNHHSHYFGALNEYNFSAVGLFPGLNLNMPFNTLFTHFLLSASLVTGLIPLCDITVSIFPWSHFICLQCSAGWYSPAMKIVLKSGFPPSRARGLCSRGTRCRSGRKRGASGGGIRGVV